MWEKVKMLSNKAIHLKTLTNLGFPAKSHLKSRDTLESDTL